MDIRLRGVAVRYGDTAALSDVDLDVGPGERVCLLGASGAGKTTALAVLSGLVAASEGTIEVLGSDPAALRGRNLRAHRARVGTVGQHLDMALSLRVVHNVNAGLLGSWSTRRSLWSLLSARCREEALAALEAVGLADRLLDRTDSLSGGERQRVAVARLLVQQPDLVLADEPTSSVDPRLADHVMELLCPADAPWTSVVCMHDPELARRHADRLVGLRAGRVVFDAAPDDVSGHDLVELYAGEER